MNSYKHFHTFSELLEQLIDNLQLIQKNAPNFSEIDKDVVLDHLRTSYAAFLRVDASNLLNNNELEEFNGEEYLAKIEAEIFAKENESSPKNETNPEIFAETSSLNDADFSEKVEKMTDDFPFSELTDAVENKVEIKEQKKFESDDILDFLPQDADNQEVIKQAPVEEKMEAEIIFEEEVKNDVEEIVAPKPEVAAVEEVEQKVAVAEKADEIFEEILDLEVEKVAEVEPKAAPIVEEKPAPSIDSLFPEEPVTPKTPQMQQPKIDLKAVNVNKSQRSLNDLLQDKVEDKSLYAQMQNRKITDLKKSIQLNDKFLYIKELFNQQGEEFWRAIEVFNACQTIEEAFNVMEDLKKRYFWDSTDPAYLSLCDLVRRKFIE